MGPHYLKIICLYINGGTMVLSLNMMIFYRAASWLIDTFLKVTTLWYFPLGYK